MTTPTPADTLRAAAERLRALLADLGDCRGPWYVVNREQRPYPQRIDNIGVPYVVASTTTDPSHPPTLADYICAMHPGVGLALAAWLKDSATLHLPDTECGYCIPSRNRLNLPCPALAVARQLLGTMGSADTADELTADEARAMAADLNIELYKARDALAFVGECCDIADREQRTVTTGDVREWLKGARCGRQLLGTTETCPECGTSGACNGGPCPLTPAAPPAPADRAATGAEWSAFLKQAADRMKTSWFTDEATAAAAKAEMRRMADEAQQPTPAATEERPIVALRLGEHGAVWCLRCIPAPHSDIWTQLTTEDLPDGGVCGHCGTDVLIPAATEELTLCGNTQGMGTTNPYRPCARPAGHPEAYCEDATGDHLFLPAATERK